MDRLLSHLRSAPLADIELPRQVGGLRDLAYNLWWAWNPHARRLFSHINPSLWAIYRNPVELLINIEPHHWEELLEDEIFMTMYQSVMRDFNRYMNARETWFSRNYPNYRGGPFVYFSTEYGLHECLRTYSGGLGVLSGDHCKSASDLGLPFIAVGLLYKSGYFEQEIEPDGRQQHFYPSYDFSRLPILPVLGDNGRHLHVEVPLGDRTVQVRVWVARIGRICLLLLDTDTPRNNPADRPITGQLYVSGREMRICQELILGMGGVRVLEALNIQPGCWHMNEGHCAFLGFERLRKLLLQGAKFGEAVKEIAKNSVFTTHTPVPAGNEQFDLGLVRKYLIPFCAELGVNIEELLALGQENGQFNLTVLAIRLSSYRNGVSKLHGVVSNQMWNHLQPTGKSSGKLIQSITNGIHTETWLGFRMADLFDKYLTPAWRDNLIDELFWKRGVPNIPDEELWNVHQLQKEALILFARGQIRNQLARHGASPDELRSVEELLDPQVLTIGFARRFATYKRADLLFHDFERLRAILRHPERPVQILFAGKAHPADKPGQELIRRIFEISRYSDLRGRIVFLENYNMRVARMMVQGVDVWLNNPRRPHEASGTSGMKAACNGAPNFSIADGWWCEAADHGKNGWTIGEGKEFDDPAAQDAHDSESLYRLLETEIAPRFYKRNADGLPVEWIKTMKASIATITPRFSTARMVRDYVVDAYLPAAKRGGAMMTAVAPEPQVW
ncbi:MAG: alpha-glucan family phosphorylase [Verrucomicrobiae bacterium]|nr:alpha-glucan family phosphorylase [Verrucomicrobiae bacterium]MDW8343112.1 alpha-glucan family phosphorylase [Verrucomicrobiae bacterium]